MFNKLKIGILGCANIAERYMINAIKSNKKFDLKVIASSSQEKAQKFKDLFKVETTVGYENIFDYDLDCVYIPLPNSLHYFWAYECLKNNMDIIVEKSLACNFEETSSLMNYAKERNLAVLESFQFRFHSCFKIVKESLENNEIGDLRVVRSSFGFPPFKDSENIRYSKSLGGGALLDAGAYTTKISQLLLGNNLEVASSNLHYSEEYDIDIWGSATLQEKRSNLTSQIAFGFDNYYQNSLEIWGSKGKIFAPRIFTSPPGDSQTVVIENEMGRNEIVTKSENQFINLLDYFCDNLVSNKNCKDREKEYESNLVQSKILEEIFLKNEN